MKTYRITIKTKYMNLGFTEQGSTIGNAVLMALDEAWEQCGIDVDDVLDVEVVPW